jgi:hypothetical protein
MRQFHSLKLQTYINFDKKLLVFWDDSYITPIIIFLQFQWLFENHQEIKLQCTLLVGILLKCMYKTMKKILSKFESHLVLLEFLNKLLHFGRASLLNHCSFIASFILFAFQLIIEYSLQKSKDFVVLTLVIRTHL